MLNGTLREHKPYIMAYTPTLTRNISVCYVAVNPSREEMQVPHSENGRL